MNSIFFSFLWHSFLATYLFLLVEGSCYIVLDFCISWYLFLKFSLTFIVMHHKTHLFTWNFNVLVALTSNPCSLHKIFLTRLVRNQFSKTPIKLFAEIPLNFNDKNGRDWLMANPVSALRFIVGQNYLYHFIALKRCFQQCNTTKFPV